MGDEAADFLFSLYEILCPLVTYNFSDGISAAYAAEYESLTTVKVLKWAFVPEKAFVIEFSKQQNSTPHQSLPCLLKSIFHRPMFSRAHSGQCQY
jgi:hypothetical protein